MRVLVTGASGFVGRHLARELAQNGHEVIAFDVAFPSPVEGISEKFEGNLMEPETLGRVVSSTRPEGCIHLAAIAFAPAAIENARQMFEVNVVGTINLLEAFRKNAPSARFLSISTAHVYAGLKADGPIGEDKPLAPLSMYGISKAAADQATLEYARQHLMQTMTARPNNHVGPGQRPPFVIASFAEQISRIARSGKHGVMHVGNMESVRDFTDVRDVVTAYRFLLEKGLPGNSYNISSGSMLTIQAAFDELCRQADVRPEVMIDKRLFRPTDSSPLLDTSKIQAHTGWKPRTPLTQTWKDILAQF